VPDIRPYLGTASVVIAPLLVAAGMQNKVLESLAMGMPTVATPRCSRTLGAQDVVHILEADEPQAFAKAIVELLDNPQLAQQMGEAGRQFVAEHYTWESAANTLNKLYSRIVNAPGRQDLAAKLALITWEASDPAEANSCVYGVPQKNP